jgi:hypothetical protein
MPVAKYSLSDTTLASKNVTDTFNISTVESNDYLSNKSNSKADLF